jgi:hypothetical protein
MSRRLVPSLLAAALAAAALAAAAPAAPKKPPPPKKEPPCEWHGIKIKKRVNVDCPTAQKVLASYYGVAYPEFKGWKCLNDPPDYARGHCWKKQKKFRFRPPPP